MLDRGAHRLFLKPHRGHRIPARPETLAMQVSLSATKLPRHGDGVLARDRPNHFSYRRLRRNPDAPGDVVLSHRPFHDGAPALPRPLTQYRTKKAPALAIPRLLPSFRDQDHVLFTIPLCV